ncbi:hypothetical protein WOLCODRAFT_141859, partial [Wolfiporia cocos MD-104 SS10]
MDHQAPIRDPRNGGASRLAAALSSRRFSLSGPSRQDHSSASSLVGHIASTSSKRALGSVPEEISGNSDHLADDFEQISYDEFRRSLVLDDPSSSTSTIDYQAKGNSILSRSKSTLNRLRRLSGLSPKKSQRESNEAEADPSHLLPYSHSSSNGSTLALAYAYPQPPATPVRHARSPPDTPLVDEPASLFYDSDPFRKVDSPRAQNFSELRSSLDPVAQRHSPDRTPFGSSPYLPRGADPQSSAASTLTPDTESTRTFSHKSLRRLRNFSKTHLSISSRKSTTQLRRPPSPPPPVPPLPPPPPPVNRIEFLVSVEQPRIDENGTFLPELTFDHIDFSSLFGSDTSSSSDPLPVPQTSLEASQGTPRDFPDNFPNLQLFCYERIDPYDPNASRRDSAVTNFPPIPPPSPQWLPRNPRDFEPDVDEPTPHARQPPPPPLSIHPRSVLSVRPGPGETDSPRARIRPPRQPSS